MRAMVLAEPNRPLELEERGIRKPGAGEVRIRVEACGVCRTDLHILDGDLSEPSLPLIPGHQIVGRVVESRDDELEVGRRVGVPWLGWTCGECVHCRAGRENLCENAEFTGYDRDGGFAEETVADARFSFPLPDGDAAELAPLLCAGLIGYRSYRIARETTEVRRLGLYGFGSAAHIIAQVAVHDDLDVYAFTREGDEKGQAFARELGAAWAGSSKERPADPLDAAILFAPVGALVPASLKAIRKAGAVVCAGIHMSDIPSFPYEDLWGERVIRSVANLERRDGHELFAAIEGVDLHTRVHRYPLEAANQALEDLREGRFEGSAVLEVADPEEGA